MDVTVELDLVIGLNIDVRTHASGLITDPAVDLAPTSLRPRAIGSGTFKEQSKYTWMYSVQAQPLNWLTDYLLRLSACILAGANLAWQYWLWGGATCLAPYVTSLEVASCQTRKR